MTEETVEEVPQKIQDLFNKALGTLERGNPDYAISQFSTCLQAEPAFFKARKFLWAARIQRMKKKGGGKLQQQLATLKNAPKYMLAMLFLSSGKSEKAFQIADAILNDQPLDLKTITLFAQSAENMEWLDVAVQAMEIGREHYPDNVPLLKALGQLYLKSGETKKARALFEHLGNIRPKDPEVLKAIKDAMALDSMSKDGWTEAAEKGQSFREIIRDAGEAALLDKQAKSVKSEKDTDALISETLAKIETEPGNVNYYRALARLYLGAKDFDQGIATLQKALTVSPGDPELDQALSTATLQKFDHEIARLKESGDEAGVAQKTQERTAYAFENLQDRVQRYPNDLKLRYEWGYALFENDYIDEAIQEFQRSQRSPQHRQKSLYYMARCFRQKKQYDLAIDQLTLAASEIEAMDATKKNILYELGEICELIEKREDAAKFYKQIYQVDIGFRDIRSKVENVYG